MSHLHPSRARQPSARAPRLALKPLLLAMGLAGLTPTVVWAQSASSGLPSMILKQGTVDTTTSTVATFNTGNSTVVVTNPNAAVVSTINGQQYTTMTINQTSQRAVWEASDFSVPAAHAFVNNYTGTATTAAATDTLINVTGGSASNIYGPVVANNRLWLVNQAGIYVGSGGSVSAASVLLSARKVAPSEEANGSYTTFMDSSKAPALTLSMEGASANDFGVGYVTIDTGGSVTATGGIVVVAPNYIGNQGTVRSTNGGNISLLAGDEAVVQLGSSGFIELGALTSGASGNNNNLVRSIDNGGTVEADEGKVQLIGAGAGNDTLFLTMGPQQTSVSVAGIRNRSTGTIRARSQDGHSSVLLQTIGDQGLIDQAGTVDANGITPTVAGKGGTITLFGGDISVSGTLTANGDAGGGQIDLISARTTNNSIFTDTGSVFQADANVAGNGGTLRVLAAPNVNSDTQTAAVSGNLSGANNSATVLGAWSAKGAGGGNGGKFILSGMNSAPWTSSRNGTQAASFDLSTSGGGSVGVWKMFAPVLLLGNQAALNNALSSTAPIGSGHLRQDDLNGLLNQGAQVHLGTYLDANVNGGNARIDVLDGTQVTSTFGGTQSLTLASVGDIWVHGASGDATAIEAGNGKLNVTIKADTDLDGRGDVRLYDDTQVNNNLAAPGRSTAQAVSALATGIPMVKIKTNGGSLDIEGSNAPTGKQTTGAAVTIDSTDLDAGTGTMNITGGLHQSWNSGVVTNVVSFFRSGVALSNSTLTAQNINIHGRGMNNHGVSISQVDFNLSNGLLAIQGELYNPNNFTEGYVAGVGIDSALVNLNNSRMTLRGLGDGTGSSQAVGVWIDNLELAVTGQAAGNLPALDVVGTSRQSGQEGVRVDYRIQLHGATANDTTTADVAIGASADAGTSASALELMYSEFKTIGRIGVRPAAFDGTGVTELVNLPIYVGSSAPDGVGTNFLVSSDLFDGNMGSGYNVVVGSSLHAGRITVEDYVFNGANVATLQNQGQGSAGIYLGAQGGQVISESMPAAAGRVKAQAAASGVTNAGTINLLSSGVVYQTPTGQPGIVANNVNVVAGPNADVFLSNPANQIGSLLVSGGNMVNVASPGAAAPSSATVTAYNVTTQSFTNYTVSANGASAPAPSPSPELQQAVASSRATVQSTEVLNDNRTDVYVKGQMGAPQVCTPTNVGGGTILSVSIDPLAQQWVQVRRSAQLSTCSAVRSDSACSAF